MGANINEGTITRTIIFPSNVMDDIKEENLHSNRGKAKEDRVNTEQEIIELVKAGIESRKAARKKK